jgi:hypothetical protein
MYQIKEEPLLGHTTPNQPSERRVQNEHAVRVAMIWQRFKEEIATGHPPDPMVASDAPHVVERRKAKRTTRQARVTSAAAKATSPSATSVKRPIKDQRKQLEAMAHFVWRLSAMKVV